MRDYKENTRYKIKTQNGFEHFEGIVRNNFEQPGRRIELADGNWVEATNTHRFYINRKEIQTKDLEVGMVLDTQPGYDGLIAKLDDVMLEVTYDIINSESNNVVYSGLDSHQSDEFAFVRGTMAEEFWTAIQPVLSAGGSAIVTSTPNTDEDQFARIWRGALDQTDEHGNPTNTGVGRNGFYPVMVTWDKHPERDEEWAEPFRQALGPARFAQEFECVVKTTLVYIKDEDGVEHKMTIGELIEFLKS